MARFLDANVPIYASGNDHPLRIPCASVVADVDRQPQEYITSVEVFQELMHRYRAQNRWDNHGRFVFERFSILMDGMVHAVIPQDAAGAFNLATAYPRLQTRDLFHVAVMQRLGVTEIISTDRGFDSVNEVKRIDPAAWTPSQ